MSHSHIHRLSADALSHEEALGVVRLSCVILLATAAIEVAIFIFTHSVALLADTVHNFSDAVTAVPLGIAFLLARAKPNRRFTYGYGRAEDLAGMAVVLIILFSAVAAGYESIRRFFYPETVHHLWVVAAAALISFAGNEGAAMLRIKTGKKIGSAALVADGYHARADGLASLAVLLGAAGVWLGFPLADPVVGLLITAILFFIAWKSAAMIFVRMMDGVDVHLTEEIRAAAGGVSGVKKIGDVRARWIGHKLYADIDIAVKKELTVSQGHEIAGEVSHELIHRFPQLGKATIHVDPEDRAGDEHHHAHHENC